MNDTSWLWIMGAVLAGAALLLVLGGGPAEAPVATPSLSEGSTVQVSGALGIAPAAEATVAPASAPVVLPARGCGCQGSLPVAPAAGEVRWVYGGQPTPCGKPACGCEACANRPAPRPACAPDPKPCDSPCVARVAPAEPAGPLAVPCTCQGPCARNEDPYWPSDQPPWPVPAPSPIVWPLGTGSSCPGEGRPGPLIDRHYPAIVDEGATAELRARIGGPSCTTVCYTWSADKGYFENAGSLTPIYHAPETDRFEGEDVCITLSSRDPCGGTGYDQIRLHIRNLNPWRVSK